VSVLDVWSAEVVSGLFQRFLFGVGYQEGYLGQFLSAEECCPGGITGTSDRIGYPYDSSRSLFHRAPFVLRHNVSGVFAVLRRGGMMGVSPLASVGP
jgi:hypothetical protein